MIQNVEIQSTVQPIGYADGYDRSLSNYGYVLIRGKRAHVLGRVCMNITMVDFTEITDVQLEDKVVLLGRQYNERILADTLTDLIGTINYEVVTRINWNIPILIGYIQGASATLELKTSAGVL